VFVVHHFAQPEMKRISAGFDRGNGCAPPYGRLWGENGYAVSGKRDGIGADERARAGCALMITQLLLVELGASRRRLLALSPTDDHHAHHASSVPASTLTITMSPGCSRAGRYSPPEEDSWQRSMT
jgi:hypothetical protein